MTTKLTKLSITDEEVNLLNELLSLLNQNQKWGDINIHPSIVSFIELHKNNKAFLLRAETIASWWLSTNNIFSMIATTKEVSLSETVLSSTTNSRRSLVIVVVYALLVILALIIMFTPLLA